MNENDPDSRLETLFSHACANAPRAHLDSDLWPRIAGELHPARPRARLVPAWAAAGVLLAALGAAAGTAEGRQLLGRLRGLFFSEVSLRLGDSAMSAREIRLDPRGESVVSFHGAEFMFRVTPYGTDKVQVDLKVYRVLGDGSRRPFAQGMIKNRIGRRIRVDARGPDGAPEFVVDLVPRQDGGGYSGRIDAAPRRRP